MTQATLITGHRDNKPQYVVCLNYVISQIESRDVIFSDCQLKAVTGCTPPAVSLPLCIPPVQQSAAVPPPVPTAVPSSVPSVSRPSKLSPVAATCSLLRDRTEDMNEGYLTFADNDSYVTILKEEPEDLTHLAPSVGEGCVPLEVATFLHGLDNFLETSSDFDLAKPQRSSSFDLKESVVDESIESLLNNPALTPQSSEEQARKTHVPSKGTRTPFVPPVPLLRPGQERRKQRVEELIQKDFQFSPKQTSSHPGHKVPDQEVTSPSSGGGSPGKRFDTPEPPQSPLLSQAASPLTPEKGVNVSFLSIGSKPIPATTRLFTSLHEENSPTSTMDLFNSLDLKLEDDLDPPINEMSVFDQDDLFSLPNPSDHQECRGDETTFGSKQKVGEAMNKFVSPNFGYFSPQHSFQQVKMGADTGGNFVDPNQVLPGQFYIKGEEKDNLQELRYLLEAPPPSPVKEAVDPPPPLKGSTSPFSYHSDKIGVKRASSPVHSIPIKRFRPTICLTTPPTIQKRELSSDRPSTANQSRDLPTPNAPLMQQLLSNEDSSLSPDSPLHPLHSFPLNKEGKVELTRQQLTALLDRAGVLRPSFRVVEGGGATPPTPREVSSPSYFSLATPAGEFAKEKQSLLVMDSNLASIPTLFDLTSFDCEVNAPAPDPSLLQGSELLMALEQTQ